MSTLRPSFITFTGVDDNTDIPEMRAIAARYPVEWGVLFSPARQGRDRRYPSRPTLKVLESAGLDLSAHLCGGHSRAIMEDQILPENISFSAYARAQINHSAPVPECIRGAFYGHKMCVVAQCRSLEFPDDEGVDWLFDPSGGRGIAPGKFPPYPARFVGYAGGIDPNNISTVLDDITATGPYWIDMESGVRSNDWFDLKLVRKVCEAVYS